MSRLISNTKLQASGAVHDCIYTMLTSGYVYEHENPYDDTLRHMTQLLVSGECERYELKIDYITMDQVCTWSQYKVNILLYGLVYLYILCIATR